MEITEFDDNAFVIQMGNHKITLRENAQKEITMFEHDYNARTAVDKTDKTSQETLRKIYDYTKRTLARHSVFSSKHVTLADGDEDNLKLAAVLFTNQIFNWPQSKKSDQEDLATLLEACVILISTFPEQCPKETKTMLTRIAKECLHGDAKIFKNPVFRDIVQPLLDLCKWQTLNTKSDNPDDQAAIIASTHALYVITKRIGYHLMTDI